MANTGTTLSTNTRYKISQAMQGNRIKVLAKLKEYKNLLTSELEKPVIPSIVAASLYAGMSKKALLAWELTTADDSELRSILNFIRDCEELYLREQGLLGKIDSKLTTLLLKAEHGINEQPTQLTQNNTFNMSPELLAEALELSRSKKTSDK